MVYFDLFYLDWLSMVLVLACPMSCANVLKILKFMISFFFFWASKCIRKKRKSERELGTPEIMNNA
jgi:hypothetical protein